MTLLCHIIFPRDHFCVLCHYFGTYIRLILFVYELKKCFVFLIFNDITSSQVITDLPVSTHTPLRPFLYITVAKRKPSGTYFVVTKTNV